MRVKDNETIRFTTAVTAINLMACSAGDADAPLWLWIAAGLFWPILVVTMQFFKPLPRD